MKRMATVSMVLAIMLTAVLGIAFVPEARADNPLPHVVVWVESQGLCYNSVVTPQPLPPQGNFQLLEPDSEGHCGGPNLKTQFGPGDVHYLGGRWILPNGVTFLCPLLPRGYAP